MKKKILLVDDDRLMLKYLTDLLEREGHEVATAQDGFAALNLLTSFFPDVMFFDLIMPKIDGDKLCRIVRNMPHLKACHLVILSAAVAELDFDHNEIGADAYGKDAAQAVELAKIERLGRGTAAALRVVRTLVPPLKEDRPHGRDVDLLEREALATGRLLAEIRAAL